MEFRIGQGIDVHAFGEGDHLTLGGVHIRHDRGLVAHSDGDVILHALCDALLGAVAQGDIGHHFPDTDPRWKGADSRVLLQECALKVTSLGWHISNVDVTVVAQAPKLAPHVDAMRERISSDLGVAKDAVSVKATTSEGLGFTGRGEGIAAFAVTILTRG